MRLILIRHCATDPNAALRYGGQASVPLNERGRAQAQATAARLARARAVALYSSDLARAAQTAEIVGAALGLAPQPTPELREIDVGEWEGLAPEELYRRFPDQMQAFARDPQRPVRAGGESYAQLQQRALAALSAIRAAHPADATVLAVSHGGVIRALLRHVIGLGLADFGRVWLDAGSLTELHHGAHGWRLIRLNDAAHLEGVKSSEF
jgi:broad specificity phosphatase PhoE